MRHKLTLLAVALLFAALVAQRVWQSSSLQVQHSAPEMPLPVAESQERELFLVPGGKYTRADIDANGRTFPSRKYRGFRARHDFNTKQGELVCPVTRTKANAACTWIIDGQKYEFCCPPCIDEFVRLAKENPEDIESAGAYVHQ